MSYSPAADITLDQFGAAAANVSFGNHKATLISNGTATTDATAYGQLLNGWLSDGTTWTYASATTFTVPGNVTTTYTKGTRLQFTQSSTVYYAVVVANAYVSSTTVTIAGTTVANSAISANSYSYAANPQGYPTEFSFAPTITASGVAPTTLTYANQTGIFSIVGGLCIVNASIQISTFTIGSGTGNAYFLLPVACSSAEQSTNPVGTILWQSGASTNTIALLATPGSSSIYGEAINNGILALSSLATSYTYRYSALYAI
jgi:hypothetical protein